MTDRLNRFSSANAGTHNGLPDGDDDGLRHSALRDVINNDVIAQRGQSPAVLPDGGEGANATDSGPGQSGTAGA